MQSEKRDYILDLVDKLQDGVATDAEIKYLTQFYLSHQESKSWPLDLKSKNIIKDKVFKNILSTLHSDLHKKINHHPFYKRNVFRYGAAACLVLLISISFLISKNTSKIAAPIWVENAIEIGTDKAVLTLEDGTAIALERDQPYVASNVSSDGETLVYAADGSVSSTEVIYNTLTIPRGAQFFVHLSDGTKVWLNSESELYYPVNFVEGSLREVELVYGEAYFEVSPSEAHKGAKFVVHSKAQKIEVVGTEFNVSAYPDESFIYTTLVKGKVALTFDLIREYLKPNQQATVDIKTQNVQIESIDVYNNVSWKDGEFSFKQMSLKDIMKVLGRWYDVDMKFETRDMEVVTFNGVLKKDQRLEDILEIIAATTQLNFEIKNKTITIK